MNDDESAPGYDRAFWEEHHRTSWETEDNPHGGEPTPHLVATATALSPGTALEAGCGDGTDAAWLACQGWTVTATDIADTALDRARTLTGTGGADVDWRRADLLTWEPGTTYDLVSSSYVHIPGRFEELVERLASWVSPTGTLLVVGHDPEDQHAREHTREHGIDHAVLSVDQLAAVLDPEAWDVTVTAETRTVRRPDRDIELRDTVLLARRR